MNVHRSLSHPALPLLAIALTGCVSTQPMARSTLPSFESKVGSAGSVRGSYIRDAGGAEVVDRGVVSSRIEDLFTARYAGLDVHRDLNGRIVMRLRGLEPLLVVDGLEADPDILGALTPQQVRSVEVLRSAAETAVYGSRGANGVVRVTTG